MDYGLAAIVVVLIGGSFLLSRRSRQRIAARESAQRENITFGTEVMTTSGLYGTVVGVNDDDTVQLSIAPGVEVKWAVAAVRDAASLPARYRGPIESDTSDDSAEHDRDPRDRDS